VFEEFGSGAAALNVRDELARGRLLADEDYRRWFRRDCAKRFGARVWHRDLSDAEIVGCPDGSVLGLSFADVGARRGIAATDAFLDLVVAHGSALRWRTTIANHRPEVLDRIARSPQIQLGFADSGAHLRNMAFYNHGLRLLHRVYRAQRAGTPFLSLPAAVHRLTGELGDWYGIDAGHLRVGGRADVAVLDPAAVADLSADYHEEPMPAFGGLRRMVNRNDDAVAATVVGGRVVHEYGRFADGFGTTLHAGRVLPAIRGCGGGTPR
jgi:N-acyl-D-glutamate deacylase